MTTTTMNWAEAKAHWMALGYNQEEFSRKLQKAFPARQGLSASRLSRKAAAQEPIEADLEQWIRALAPRAGHQGRSAAALAGMPVAPAQIGARATRAPLHVPEPAVFAWKLPPALWGLAAGGFSVVVALLLLLLVRMPAPRPEPLPNGSTAMMPAPVLSETPQGQVARGAQIPAQPLPGQARPPCPSRMDKIINGGCWIGPIPGEVPPCPPADFEQQGGCYASRPETRTRPPQYSDEHLDGGQP